MNTDSSESQLVVLMKLSSAASSLDGTALQYPVVYTTMFNIVIKSSHIHFTLTLLHALQCIAVQLQQLHLVWRAHKFTLLFVMYLANLIQPKLDEIVFIFKLLKTENILETSLIYLTDPL